MVVPPKTTPSRRRRGVAFTRLRMPVIGLESEFNIWVDGIEVIPETYWKAPRDFIDQPMLTREKTSSQLPTGGAVYFDRGVIEVVTPVIEIAPACTARVVRNLWEQIDFIRGELSKWEARTGHHVRLKAYSTHYNISFELRNRELTLRRNIKKLALLLAYILPVPVMLAGANRASTGVGVRPRGDRIEITVDFTPDPGRMIATATLIVGIVREVISWSSYELSEIDRRGIPVIAGVVPGKHTTRKGWLTKDFHYPRSPYTCDLDRKLWKTSVGTLMSLREIGWLTAWKFKTSLRRHSDPFSMRLLFAILEGRALSLLDLDARPAAYEDVGRLCKWGSVIDELRFYESAGARKHRQEKLAAKTAAAHAQTARLEYKRATAAAGKPKASLFGAGTALALRALSTEPLRQFDALPVTSASRGSRLARTSLLSKPGVGYTNRRRPAKTSPPKAGRRARERRSKDFAVPFPDRRLKRSAYEQVFLRLVSGRKLKIGSQVYAPIGMKGWYHAVFRRVSDGKERLLTIDQLLERMDDWLR